MSGKNHRKGKTVSAESKALMNQTKLNFNFSDNIISNSFINVYSPEKVLLSQYVSAKEAAKDLNISNWSVLKYKKSGLLFNNKYFFTFDLIKSDINLTDEIFFNLIITNSSTKPVKLYIYSLDLPRRG